MKLLPIIFLFSLVQVIRCHIYDEIAKDECFKKVYTCGDYRRSVTSASGRLVTEPYRFSEICRKHKEFIACIENAAHFCSGKFTNISRMILDNRISLNLFCTDLEWKRNYLSSAKCINDNEKTASEECVKEENDYKDSKPYICLISEPCESLERVFACNVRKMKQLCGSVAAEVYRRMHILKMENRDILCEIRQRNSMHCNFKAQRPSDKESIKRIGSLSVSLSEAVNNIFEAALVDTMDNFALLLNEENLSNLFDSEEFNLRKTIFKSEIEEKLGPFLKKCKLPEGEFLQPPDLSVGSFSLLFRNIKKIVVEASFQNSKHAAILYETLLKSCGTENVDVSNCLDKLRELEEFKSNAVARISKDLNAELKPLKDYVLGLFELLNCNEDFLINSISEDAVAVTWDNMNSFPLETLSCDWKNEKSKKVFQCFFKLKAADQIHEDIQPDTSEAAMTKENVNEFIRPFAVETSSFVEFGSGMADDSEEQGIGDSSVADTSDSKFDAYDIHRSGQVEIQKEIDSEEVFEEIVDTNFNEFEESKQTPNQEAIVDTDSVSYYSLLDSTANIVKFYLDSLKVSISTTNSESPESVVEDDSEKSQLEKDVRLRLSKIEEALDERFADIEIKVSQSKKSLNSDFERTLEFEKNYQSYHWGRGIKNQSPQAELDDFLTRKLNEYIELYSIYSKIPVAPEIALYEVRRKRQTANERKNSKMDKSFTIKSTNDSVRPNSKFKNFKAEL